MTRRVSKIILYFTVTVFLFCVGLIGFSQTSTFRQNLRSMVYSVVSRELNASVYLGEIRGNIFTGISIDTLALYVDNTSVLESGSVDVRYDLFPLWKKHVDIVSFSLRNPAISLVRYRDGSWNVDHLIKRKSQPDTVPSSWTIIVRQLKITNARFRLIDSTGTTGVRYAHGIERPIINFSDIDLQHLTLDLNGRYSAADQNVTIKQLSFFAPREKFLLQNLSASVRHSASDAVVQNLLISTPDSHIELSASMSATDVFAIRDLSALQRVPTQARITSSVVSFNDLQSFLPSLYFLRGAAYVDASVDGEFGSLQVRKLDVSFGQSAMHLGGKVSNLHRPADLTLNVQSNRSLVNLSDVPALLPFYSIPNYQAVGTALLDFQYVGKPLDFNVKARMETPAGSVEAEASMNLTGSEMTYDCLARGSGVNLMKFLGTASLQSNLYFSATMKGRGTSIDKLRSAASIEIDSSVVNGIPVTRATASVTAAQKKIEMALDVRSPKGNIALRPKLDYSAGESPTYQATGSVRTLDLSAFLKDEHYSSACSFDFGAEGNRLSLSDAFIHSWLQFRTSRFGAYLFDSARVDLNVTQEGDSTHRIQISSPVADVLVEGNFTFDELVRTMKLHLTSLEKAYEQQRRILDTTMTMKVARSGEGTSAPDSADRHTSLRYAIAIKNLTPLAVFLDMPLFNAIGTIDGNLNSRSQLLSFEGKISLQQGTYAHPTQPMAARNAVVTYVFRNIVPENLLAENDTTSYIDLQFRAKDISFGSTVLHAPSIDCQFERQHGIFAVTSDIDTTMNVAAVGNIDLTRYSDQILFTTLSARYQGYELKNQSPVRARLSARGVELDSSIFAHLDEHFAVRGSMDFDGRIAANASISDFDLSNIFYFSTSADFRSSALAFGGTVNAAASLDGTLSAPLIELLLSGKNISYRESKFGGVSVSARYAHRATSVRVEFSGDSLGAAHRDVSLTGTIPMDLSLTSTEHRFDLDGLDLRLTANRLQIGLFDPFIPEIDQLSGEVQSALRCSGSLAHPIFSGTAELRKGSFVFALNNLPYTAEGNLLFDSNKVTFSSFTIKNTPDLYDAGTAIIGGSILLKGFVPDEYHLEAHGELLALNERTRNPENSFFGNLIAATGPEGLRFEGNYQRSRLSGTILVRQASLTFPPTQQAAGNSSSHISDIIIIDDTSKAVKDTTGFSALVPAFAGQIASRFTGPSFLDGLGYELGIQTQGVVRVQMIFNANAGAYEELYAELNGKLTLVKEGKDVRLTGTINVSDQSNYNFYKKFNASGSLTFTGRPDNPQLNIIAKYEGTHIDPKDTEKPPKEKKVIVSLTITGNRTEPKIKIDLATLDENGKEIERTGDVQNDAIAFLLTSSPGVPGKFRDDLTANDRTDIATRLGNSISTSYISGLLSGFIMDFVQKNRIPFVKKAEFKSIGVDPDLRLSGEVRDIYFNVGGKVFTDLNNANISVQLPLGDKKLRNFIFEVERKVETLDYNNQYRTTLGARVYYRITF